jgi:hypothetical protein
MLMWESASEGYVFAFVPTHVCQAKGMITLNIDVVMVIPWQYNQYTSYLGKYYNI